MAAVFLAELSGMHDFSKLFAVKLFHPHLALHPEFSQWFVGEARLGSQLSHTNLVETLDFGEEDGYMYLVLEYVDGASLDRLLSALHQCHVTIPLAMALQIMVQICAGLEYAHSAASRDGHPLRLVHRDLKPANLLVDAFGCVKIADFGVARAETNPVRTQHSGTIKGTVHYMSPEQAWGVRELDHRSDLFSVGVILYELLTSRHLYQGGSTEALLRQAQDAIVEPQLAHLPVDAHTPAVHRFLSRALARRPEDRFQSAAEMSTALRTVQAGLDEPLSLRAWLDQVVWPLLEDNGSEAAPEHREESYETVPDVQSLVSAPRQRSYGRSTSLPATEPYVQEAVPDTLAYRSRAHDTGKPPGATQPPADAVDPSTGLPRSRGGIARWIPWAIPGLAATALGTAILLSQQPSVVQTEPRPEHREAIILPVPTPAPSPVPEERLEPVDPGPVHEQPVSPRPFDRKPIDPKPVEPVDRKPADPISAARADTDPKSAPRADTDPKSAPRADAQPDGTGLVVASLEEGARAFLDGKTIAIDNNHVRDISKGTHSIRFVFPTGQPPDIEFTAEEGTTVRCVGSRARVSCVPELD